MRKRERYRSNHKKEKAIMLASSLFVLSALTMTGFYVKEKNQKENDGYVVDFDKLENNAGRKAEELADAANGTRNDVANELQAVDDLDYDPLYREANSSNVTNEDMQKPGTESDSARADRQAAEASAAAATKNLSFGENDILQWPIAGNVLLNYSMDKTIYFPTLQQYKYNPAIVIGAAEGAMITAAADGVVSAVYEDAEIGQAVDIIIGNGYEITYGQLKDSTLMNGDVVKAGDIVGYVDAPSKYYSAEGSNVYFKLTKDGIPRNPLTMLE